MDDIMEIKLSMFLDSFDIIEYLRELKGFESHSPDSLVYTTNQIWYRGYNYKINYVVCFDMGPIFPKFGIISEFLVINENNCLLVIKEIDVQYYERDYFAYKVIETCKLKLINVRDLVIHECMEFQRNCKMDGLFLVPRHFL